MEYFKGPSDVLRAVLLNSPSSGNKKGQMSVRLKLCRALQEARYITLMHAWGPVDSATTPLILTEVNAGPKSQATNAGGNHDQKSLDTSPATY